MDTVDVVIAGAGPIGLTAAIELRRHGVRVRIVDPLPEAPQYAKAVGIQPRTLEILDGMGVLRQILDAGVEMKGQIVYVNGAEASRVDLDVPADIPFRFLCVPQYATEHILHERLRALDGHIERGLRVVGFEQDVDGVTVKLMGPSGPASVRARYLVGCDGAHSVVRKSLGLSFEGAAFAEQYMLGDVAVDWSQPRGYAIRCLHQTRGDTDDGLVCIPLPGRGRYRMSMQVPADLSDAGSGTNGDGIAHGFEGARRPELSHIQAVVDRLAPEPATVSDLRWSSVFRISHRIVDSYSRGRVFVAGDAAHIHPPTGAQGMNTGIQDAHNLAWKLALSVRGEASEQLLDSYDAERRPVGEEVVERTVRNARVGIDADSSDPSYIMRREAQLLISYADSPIVGGASSRAEGPQPGQRAPDAAGLERDAVNFPIRLFALLGRLDHSAILYVPDAAGAAEVTRLESLADAMSAAAHGRLDIFVVAAPEAQVGTTDLPLVRDATGGFVAAYRLQGATVLIIRPDGYLSYRGSMDDSGALIEHLGLTFGRVRVESHHDA